MHDISRAALAAALLLGLAAPAGAQDAEAQDRGAEAQEIADAAQALWAEAFNAGDGPAAAEAIFAEDARMLPPDSPPLEGRQAIGEFWQEVFDSGTTDMSFDLIDATMVGDDTLIETGTSTYTFVNEQGETEPGSSKFIHIWERQDDGSWRITHDIWNYP